MSFLQSLSPVVTHTPLEYVVGMTFILMGISILRYPVYGTMNFITTVTGLHADFVATLLIVSGGFIMTKPVSHWFIILTIPFMVYVIFSVIYAWLTPGVSVVFAVIYVSYYVLMIKYYQVRVEDVWIKVPLKD